jgi:hypothetical protein
MAMSEAISAFYRTFGLDDVPSGSSPQSRLRALAAMCAGDSAGRCITVFGGPSPSSLPTITWIWSGSARATAYLLTRMPPWPRPKGLMRLPRVQAWRWLPFLRWRSFRPCHCPRLGHTLTQVEMTPTVLLLPLSTPEPVWNSYFKYVYVFYGRCGLIILGV